MFAAIGFVLGFALFWGGCGKFGEMGSEGYMLGAVLALLGGILGANMAKK